MALFSSSMISYCYHVDNKWCFYILFSNQLKGKRRGSRERRPSFSITSLTWTSYPFSINEGGETNPTRETHIELNSNSWRSPSFIPLSPLKALTNPKSKVEETHVYLVLGQIIHNFVFVTRIFSWLKSRYRVYNLEHAFGF